jgi:hypothetical protein
MVAPIVPIAAGVGSFLLAKASGASNRDALIAGGIGALGAYGIGTAAGLGTSSVAAKGTILGTLGGSQTAAALTGIGAGTLGSMAMRGQPGQAQPLEEMNVGFKGVDPQQYAQATENLQGITQRATYADAPSTDVVQPSVYDFTNQEMYTAKEGGLAEIKRFREGGVNYLPSKTDHDENDYNNYTRAKGYVEDGSGNGDKDEDTMLAQLADGEFVSRADAILGAGIMEGASPEDFKEMRRLGAKFFYKQQDQLKRIYDITS